VARPDAEAVLITGVFGTGKSSLTAELAYELEQRGAPYAATTCARQASGSMPQLGPTSST
jgi:putative protein kinase ArgK-like GTPase of G3E family